MDNILNLIRDTAMIAIWFIVLLVPVVVFHEFGHFLIARLTKTRVPEFGVGIPPRVVGKRWKGVLWSLNSIPLGGFVRIFGDGDSADAALDAMKQIEENTQKDGDKKANKVLKQQALEELKARYQDDRLQELAQNQELDYFLENQGMTLGSEWKEQIKSNKLDDKNLEQIKTLISWEFDSLPKNKEVFYNKPYFAKVLIMLGGITANFVLAWFILTILLAFFDISPAILPNVPVKIAGVELNFMSKGSNDKLQISSSTTDIIVTDVIKGSIAQQQNFETGNKIISLNGQTFNTTDQFLNALERLGGNEITIKLQDTKGGISEKKFNLPVKEAGKPQLGVSYFQLYSYKAKSFFDASSVALDIIWNTSISLFVLLGGILQFLFGLGGNKDIINAVGGPVAIGAQGDGVYKEFGVQGILTVMALISINLGIFNLIPIPALDGGRVLILTLQKITGKRNRKLEYTIITGTFIFLLVLGLLVMIKDIGQIK